MKTEQLREKYHQASHQLDSSRNVSRDVIAIDPLQDPRWDALVETHPNGWVCHLSAWKSVLEHTFPHMRGHYLALLGGGETEIRAGLPLFEVNSWLGKKLVSIPFATLSDPLISTTGDMNLLLNAALNLAADLRISHLEIRSFKTSPLIHDFRLDQRNNFKLHSLMLDEGLEKLKNRFHLTSVRQCINRALKSDFVVEPASNHRDLYEFYRLYCLTRKRLGLPSQPLAFFENLWDAFASTKKMVVLLARHKGLAVAGLINFRFNCRVSYETVGSDMGYRHLCPEHLLVWESIKQAQGDGYAIFDFGRTSVLNKGLMTFKQRWGTEVADLPHFYYPRERFQHLRSNESSLQYRLIRKTGYPLRSS